MFQIILSSQYYNSILILSCFLIKKKKSTAELNLLQFTLKNELQWFYFESSERKCSLPLTVLSVGESRRGPLSPFCSLREAPYIPDCTTSGRLQLEVKKKKNTRTHRSPVWGEKRRDAWNYGNDKWVSEKFRSVSLMETFFFLLMSGEVDRFSLEEKKKEKKEKRSPGMFHSLMG